MTGKEYPRLGEKVFRRTLGNGLEVIVVSKPRHAKRYAFFATRYGGMDMRFRLSGAWQDTPAGIAHYLEHKMFDTEEGNALQELAKNGALSPCPTSPRRAWRRSRASSPRRSAWWRTIRTGGYTPT